MKFLLINNHFSQDIDSLVRSFPAHYAYKIVDANYFAWKARRYLPEPAFSTDFGYYYRPELSRARARWKQKACRALHELFMVFPFDIILSPSDTYVYIRDVITAAREMGVPFLVLTRETTNPLLCEQINAPIIAKGFPFISDHLMVCSERHKRFWQIAGAPEHKIEVTGQPRFDFYQQPELWKPLQESGVFFADAAKPTILFLSYELYAYLSYADYEAGTATWAELRDGTVKALVEVAAEHGFNLMVKPHPQQPPDDVHALEAQLQILSREGWNSSVVLLSGDFDTRQLIVNADVIVGFQSTTLYESLMAGKPTIYTCWTDPLKKMPEGMIFPFDQYTHVLECATSPDHLRALVRDAARNTAQPDETKLQKKRRVAEEYMGPCDGKATARVLAAVERALGEQALQVAAGRELREQLISRRYGFCLRETCVAYVLWLFWMVIHLTASCLRRCWPRMWNASARRVDWYRRRARECGSVIGWFKERDIHLVGRVSENYALRVQRFFSGLHGIWIYIGRPQHHTKAGQTVKGGSFR